MSMKFVEHIWIFSEHIENVSNKVFLVFKCIPKARYDQILARDGLKKWTLESGKKQGGIGIQYLQE